MIKAKKSKGEIAGAFWKAATAANAFKPRPGGAGERLRQNQNKTTDGPDGITSVVPAPPRPASVQKPSTPVASPEPPVRSPGRSSNIPEVKVTVPDATRPSSVEQPVPEAKKPEETEELQDRKSIISGNDAKYLTSLGIDPSILDARSTEFAKWLDYFGWVPGEQMRARTFDDMKHDVERELNKAQAGGWIARFREEDGRIDAIKKGIDLAINECDELDNLLTLYSVELSVRRTSDPRQRRLTDICCRHSTTILPISKPKDKVSRSRQQTRSCSRRSSSHYWRHVQSAHPTWKLCGPRPSKIQ
jgi:hypothetical protein